MKIKYTNPHPDARYHGTYAFRDGDVRDVPEAEAQRLIRCFPTLFAIVIDDETAKEMRPSHNKALKPKRTK